MADDWAEQHHDVELMDASGRRSAKGRLPEATVGMTKLHAMIAEQLDEAAEEAQAVIGIETAAVQAALRTEHLGRPAAVTAVYAATIGSAVAVLTVPG
ncbi:hypothetical protein ACWDS7_33530, partial [Streptosporangium sp. NPDC003464]